MKKPLINKRYRLEKFHGKGGWTYARIPEIPSDKRNPFGWVRVKGFIDDYAFCNYHLMPMGKGKLFLPVKSEIRKKIKKQEGDWVNVILYPDNDPIIIPPELQLCLLDEPGANQFFQSLSDSEKKFYIEWIYNAKKEKTRIGRIVKTIGRLSRGLKMYEKDEPA
ncbi:MAG TPA: YdeI/OmpD-associated family protein [Chitinophagaceae bacterium]|nr:YdeI/OmpD-associated family protein [Chitinophagaceae bacterium]